MTNHWIDIKNSDVVLIMGSNPAENHPMSFRWVQQARKDKNATVIVVDPRITRSAVQADIYVPIRSGTDIAFMGGIFKYVLEQMKAHPENFNMEYVLNYTDAGFKLKDTYAFTQSEGKFSDKATWVYETDANNWPVRIDTTDPAYWTKLWDPAERYVLGMMLQHYSRYTAEAVCSITGSPIDDYRKVQQAIAASGPKDKSMSVLYAMGTTQHTYGSQNVRAFAVLQLLLGNIGVAGGGIMTSAVTSLDVRSTSRIFRS